MNKTHALKPLRNQKGMALLETVPLLVIFVMLMSFGMGFFGIAHTAVLHSIAARTYAFETFRQRTNLTYFREDQSALTGGPKAYARKGWRYHAVQNEGDSRELFVPSARNIAIGRGPAEAETSKEVHNQQVFSILPRNERVSVNPAWIMVGYGMCLRASCGN